MLRRRADAFEPADPEDEVAPGPPPRRRRGGRKTTFGLVAVALIFLAVAVLRVFGIDGNQFTVPAVALTPYVAAGSALLAVIGLPLRRRIYAIATGILAVILIVLLLPRMFAGD